jgi:hypothetical protein
MKARIQGKQFDRRKGVSIVGPNRIHIARLKASFAAMKQDSDERAATSSKPTDYSPALGPDLSEMNMEAFRGLEPLTIPRG